MIQSWASDIAAPLDNYGVVIPQWEVEVSPAGPTVLLNGTVEEVHAELLKLNPDWDTEYLPKKSSFRLAKRYDFTGAQYFCGDRWPPCSTDKIVEGIRYLRGVGGQPINGPGPGKCSRVSCSYNSAIWWCNDVSSTPLVYFAGENWTISFHSPSGRNH